MNKKYYSGFTFPNQLLKSVFVSFFALVRLMSTIHTTKIQLTFINIYLISISEGMSNDIFYKCIFQPKE